MLLFKAIQTIVEAPAVPSAVWILIGVSIFEVAFYFLNRGIADAVARHIARARSTALTGEDPASKPVVRAGKREFLLGVWFTALAGGMVLGSVMVKFAFRQEEGLVEAFVTLAMIAVGVGLGMTVMKRKVMAAVWHIAEDQAAGAESSPAATMEPELSDVGPKPPTLPRLGFGWCVLLGTLVGAVWIPLVVLSHLREIEAFGTGWGTMLFGVLLGATVGALAGAVKGAYRGNKSQYIWVLFGVFVSFAVMGTPFLGSDWMFVRSSGWTWMA